ncbi:hypothetical protein Lser_V15G32296 [Lactuca serriola]
MGSDPCIFGDYFPSTISFNDKFNSTNPFSSSLALNVAHDVEWTPNSISYSKLLSQCCQTKSLYPGLQIHTHLIKVRLENSPKHRNHLVNLYSKCLAFDSARKLLDESPEPDLVAWSTLISGYAKNGLGKEALLAFIEMHSLGIRCKEFTFPSFLKACSMKKDIIGGKQIHGIVILTGFQNDVFVANTLVDLYAKCVSWNAMFSCYKQGDFFKEAIDLFQDMFGNGLIPDEFSLSTIINACTGLQDIIQRAKIHGYLIKHGYTSDPFSCNALVDMYSKVGDFEDAKTVFDHIPNPDIVSWNAIIAGCVLHEYYNLCLELFFMMKRSGITPNKFTYSSVLKACSGLGLQYLGQQFHSFLTKSEIELDLHLCCGLIDIYSKCGEMDDAQRVYDMMPKKELIALNALLSGHCENGNDIEAMTLFAKHMDEIGFDETTLIKILKSSANLQDVYVSEQIHGFSLKSGFQSDPFVINNLIVSYSKCGHVEMAKMLFDELDTADLATFTSLINGYAQLGQGEEAIKLYLKMQDLELKPDSYICSSLLKASTILSAYEQGKQIHVHTLKSGFLSDVFTANSLVDMYARCGSIEDASRAFFEVPEKGIVSWSAMIGGLAQHGYGKEALSLFDKMLKDGIAPNNVTLASVLSACNHAGLVTQAKTYFETMEGVFGIKPTQEHYACMIDILGRSGKLDEAMDLLSRMPFKANASVWGRFLVLQELIKTLTLVNGLPESFLFLNRKNRAPVLFLRIYTHRLVYGKRLRIQGG